MKTLRVNASESYEVRIGGGLLARVGCLAKDLVPVGKAVIVSGEKVYPLYGERLKTSLASAGFEVLSFVHASGESAKSLESYGALMRFLSEKTVSRTDTLFALGGGVTGDFAGFAAATYRRGMNYIQIPTTLLAAVDASVGGKTALNLPAGKNMIGAFYQPKAVFCDTDTLRSLPAEEYRGGCAEIIKCAVLCGGELFSALEKSDIHSQEEEIIYHCVCAKRDLVERDEFDTGARMLLNLGHTLGHAVEKCSSYSISHGYAVAIGLSMICTAAAEKGILAPDERDRILALLKKISLPLHCEYHADELFAAAMSDKKITDGLLHPVVPEGIGSCRILSLRPEEFRTWIV